MALRETGDADGETARAFRADEADQTLGVGEAFRMGGEGRLPLGRIAAQGQDVGDAGGEALRSR